MKYYTIGNNRNIIYGGNVNDGRNDITKCFIKQSDNTFREFENHDSHCDYECFNALKTGRLHTFNSLAEAQAYVK